MLQILQKLQEWWSPKPQTVAGPRRVKHYGAQTGFQYRYQLQKSLPGEYDFVLWTSGLPVHLLHISVPLEHLAARDRYALAKLHLFRTLDECGLTELPEKLEVTETTALDEL